MDLETKDSAPEKINLLELIPERNIGWEKDEEGFVVLLKPKLQHPFLQKHVLSKLKRPYYKIKLDEIGSYFWEYCDGTRTVNDIAAGLANHFGERIEPLYDRIALFIQSLEKNKFIRMKGR